MGSRTGDRPFRRQQSRDDNHGPDHQAVPGPLRPGRSTRRTLPAASSEVGPTTRAITKSGRSSSLRPSKHCTLKMLGNASNRTREYVPTTRAGRVHADGAAVPERLNRPGSPAGATNPSAGGVGSTPVPGRPAQGSQAARRHMLAAHQVRPPCGWSLSAQRWAADPEPTPRSAPR